MQWIQRSAYSSMVQSTTPYFKETKEHECGRILFMTTHQTSCFFPADQPINDEMIDIYGIGQWKLEFQSSYNYTDQMKDTAEDMCSPIFQCLDERYCQSRVTVNRQSLSKVSSERLCDIDFEFIRRRRHISSKQQVWCSTYDIFHANYWSLYRVLLHVIKVLSYLIVSNRNRLTLD